MAVANPAGPRCDSARIDAQAFRRLEKFASAGTDIFSVVDDETRGEISGRRKSNVKATGIKQASQAGVGGNARYAKGRCEKDRVCVIVAKEPRGST